MKLQLAAAATLPILATGYNMGPYMFGRGPSMFVSPGACSPRASNEWADRAFDNLADELNSENIESRRKRRKEYRKAQEENFRRQQELINRAFNLATDVAEGMSSKATESREKERQQQKEWVDRAFNIANDVASGLSSPRYEVNDGDEAFQVALDVPGVKASDIDISVVKEDGQQVLSIKGQRDMGIDKEPTKFSKQFSLDATVDTDKITASLNNGVLLVSAPKEIKKEEVKKIPVMQVSDETISVIKKDVELGANKDEAKPDSKEPEVDDKEEGDSNEEKQT